MDGVVGVLLVAATIPLFGWAIIEYRRPIPGRWTRAGTLDQAIVLATMGFLALGVGFLVRYVIRFSELPPTTIEMASISAIIVMLWIVIRVLRARWRRIVSADQAAIEIESKVGKFPSSPPVQYPTSDHRPPHSSAGGKRAAKRKAA